MRRLGSFRGSCAILWSQRVTVGERLQDMGLLLIRSSFITCLRKSSLKLPRTRKKPRFQKENVACHIHICKNISLNVAVKFLMRK